MSNFEENVAKFGEILKQFNKIHSLTNYKDIKNQVMDSIAPLEFLDINPKIAIDIGSGAGFPAIFLAMKIQECEWHLFEPNLKKSSFLSYAKINLGLKNITVHSKKIQEGEKFKADLITSRALMKTKDLIKICDGFYDENTKFMLYKGSSVVDELDGLKAKIYNNKNRNYIIMSVK
ncbi:16S rRNA m7G527 methyltransferase [Campylobacter pinnipediorum subsp. caledonicus]|uniref:Ribosomal RNA small subunit methyltransferase G n=1 Tax=Campylobacter pinnipediorum subsp. caledonicus TaxID=1874362 RepID=A0A1S6U8Z1_9BACT|nr:16S rRNA (guanine(527)-N(7))-methyltransferase RsmG [Campylobacter pinnipediorum]AQW88221.1 16S rRNA m7G527 methyltransferase [Campylobacter pinnipediorum subsp. caledonicus]OPA71659.1 16S rRNA (guanine(527)-N(7))-methyltransferase RsmG [Campylobacter pinnipediorum subsp. caledonicus]